MKSLLVLAAMLAVIGCSSKDKAPEVPPVVVKPPVLPVDPVPPVLPEAGFCKSEGKKFSCGTNEWWKFNCGGNMADEQVYFVDKAEVVAQAQAKGISSCVKIFYKKPTGILPSPMPPTEEIVHFGFGPCLPCQQL